MILKTSKKNEVMSFDIENYIYLGSVFNILYIEIK